MTTTRTQRRKEVKEKLKLAADRLNEEKRNQALTAFQQKYSKCTDALLAQYGGTASSMVSLALLNAAEEITQKLLRDANVIAKKAGHTQIESSDVNFASLNLYNAKDRKREEELQKAVNSQRFPPVGNTAMHFGPLQKVLVAPARIELPTRQPTPSQLSYRFIPRSSNNQI